MKISTKNLKPTSSHKIQSTKHSNTGKAYPKSINSKRNKSYDFYQKKPQPRKPSKEYKRIKDYIQAKSYQKLGSQRENNKNKNNSKRKSMESNFLKSNSTETSSTEESKIAKKKLSIEIPNSTGGDVETEIFNNFSIPKDLGPHRSVSVQNRTTTITTFTTLSPEDDKKLDFLPTKVEEHIPLKSGKDIIVPNFDSTKTSVK